VKRIAVIIVLLSIEAALPRAASSQNVYSQNISLQSAHPKITHIDSLIGHEIIALIAARVGSDVILVTDSSFLPLVELSPKPTAVNAPMFYLERFSAVLHDLRGQLHEDMDVAGRIDLELEGALLTQGSHITSKKLITSMRTLSTADMRGVETSTDRFVQREVPVEQSFWAKTVAPVLVILGAAAIVALFFLVRG
jgi:hypothetical protein